MSLGISVGVARSDVPVGAGDLLESGRRRHVRGESQGQSPPRALAPDLISRRFRGSTQAASATIAGSLCRTVRGVDDASLDPKAVGVSSAPVSVGWTSKDALLYAVGIGVGQMSWPTRRRTRRSRPARLSHVPRRRGHGCHGHHQQGGHLRHGHAAARHPVGHCAPAFAGGGHRHAPCRRSRACSTRARRPSSTRRTR